MFKLGDLTIHRMQEMTTRAPATIYDGWSAEAAKECSVGLAQSAFDAATETFTIAIQNWLIVGPTFRLVIDTGVGNDKERPTAPHLNKLKTTYLEEFARTGVRPEDVDYVINTHLHTDHVGWNTRLVDGLWEPTFRNATYVMPRVEYEARDPRAGAAQKPPASHLPFLDSVEPIARASKLRLVEGDEQLFEGVDLLKIPGHSPGQMAVRLRSRGQEMLFVADVLHQPVQIYRPQWTARYCEDPSLALRTRAALLEYCASHRPLVVAGHFSWPYGGYIERQGTGFAFVPADEQNGP